MATGGSSAEPEPLGALDMGRASATIAGALDMGQGPPGPGPGAGCWGKSGWGGGGERGAAGPRAWARAHVQSTQGLGLGA